MIFSASLKQGRAPDDWKEVNVSPIFKKGDKCQPTNYRPVSLTSVCSKVLEHIIHSHLMYFFEDSQILCDQQHGFRKHRSCESQLLTKVQDLASGLDNQQQMDAILLDFSKAFDKVPHQRLLMKLEHYGVRGTTLQCIRSFLSDRTQKVVVEGKPSSSAPVTSGVPNGTVLGPLLFLAYINDLPSRVKAKARLFADDCLLYRNIKTNEDAESLQDDLNKLQDWETDWQMHFNPDKCELIRITNKRKTINAMYQIHGVQLKQKKKAKYLGLTFTNTLSWNAHIDTITKKANNTTAFLRRNLSMCPRKVKDTCYKTFVKPQVEYAATVWDPHTTESIKKVKAVQRRAARFVTGDYRTASSVTAMVDSLSWDPPPPTQKTANQGHYDVPDSTRHGSHTSLTTPSTPRCCHTRPSVQIQGTILPDQHIQELLLPVNHQAVEPAARRTDCCRIPGCLQSRDISRHKALDSQDVFIRF